MGPAVDRETGEDRPALRIITPDATPEEVAALVAVLSALGTGQEAGRPAPRLWSSPARLLRTPRHAGPGAWRASGLP